MKVALLTIWREKNYGAELQAYATVKLLQNLGHTVEMIDIRLSDGKKGNFNQKVYSLICDLTPGHRKFLNFWKKHIPVTCRFKTIKQLQKEPPKADVYLVGSDQVWNPEITKEFSLLYFLNFGDDNVKRISFASSFGTATWNHPELKNQVCQLLKRFHYITCREKTGVSLLKTEFGIDATNVADPTLVLGDYANLAPNIQEKNTLLYYQLGHDPELETFAIELSRELNLRPLKNNKKKMLLGKLEWNRVGVEEWVTNIAESSFVVTRSFHGLVFSLLFHRQFAIVATPNGRNNRIIDLLTILELQNRYFESFDQLYNQRIWEKEINYIEVDDKINLLRKIGIDELSKALES